MIIIAVFIAYFYLENKCDYTVITKTYCIDDEDSTVNDLPTYPTIQEATEVCNADDNCAYIYDEECDNKPPYKTCKSFAKYRVAENSCIYKKEGSMLL